jgi:beta-N-acetylhexosaminidase
VIGIRAFGSDQVLVARHVAAFVQGLQMAGVAACAKHFPGHGATDTDSHLELPSISADLDELREGELVPFRAAIEAGVKSVMTAHILVPAVDTVPATISRALLHDLLRVELGYDGLVITDALEMRAISATVGVEEGAVRALAAGADALCLGHDLEGDAVESVRRAIVAAVRGGRLDEERLAEAAGRVARTGAWTVEAERLSADRTVGRKGASRALRLEGDTHLHEPVLVVECVPERMMAADPLRRGLGAILVERDPRSAAVRLAGDADVDEIAGNGRRPVLVVRDPARHEWERGVAARLVALRPDTIVVDVGYPGWRLSTAAGYVTTYGAGRVNLEAAADALLGA